MASITFRRATEADKAVFPWKPRGVNQTRPTVITINGHVVIMNHCGELLYQRADLLGPETIAALLRAEGSIARAMRKLTYEGQEEISRRGKASRLHPAWKDPLAALRDFVRP